MSMENKPSDLTDIKPNHTTQCRKKKDEKALQQSFLVYLLSKLGDVVIMKPGKHSVKTHQMLFVKDVCISNESIDVYEIIESRLRQFYSDDIQNGVEEEKAKRRNSPRRMKENNNILSDILVEFDYFFNFKRSKFKEDNSFNIISDVYLNGHLLYSSETIELIADRVNKYLTNKFPQCELTYTVKYGELDDISM